MFNWLSALWILIGWDEEPAIGRARHQQLKSRHIAVQQREALQSDAGVKQGGHIGSVKFQRLTLAGSVPQADTRITSLQD